MGHFSCLLLKIGRLRTLVVIKIMEQNGNIHRTENTFYGTEGKRAVHTWICTLQRRQSSSARKTRAKPIKVAINKLCGKKKCVVRRTKLETYIAWKTQAVCCSGWQYNNENDSCAPLCSTGCNGGRCTAPDTCTCDPPSVKHPQHKNACIIPECNPPCVNGACINDTCVCRNNYETFNSTHCYHCEPGFNLAADFTCVKCDCPNGSCINNTCICDSGYVMKDNACQPICDACIGTCVGPNVCRCVEGYANVSGMCEPVCDKCDGKCVSPNVCQCLDGFRYIGGRCEPECNCENCLAPNVCDCASGYKSDNGTCIPVCTKCVNGYCSAPDVCSCNEGFMRNSDGVCQACSEFCTCNANGECLEQICQPYSRSNMLGCCAGYIYDRASNTCRAKCNNGCKNGTCITQNNCVCTPPLVLINGNECVNPICDNPCTHGQCTAPNVCTCETGYAHVDQFTCEPICDTPCIHGNCVAPNKCICSPGYALVNDTCQPVCDECHNGDCVAPNDCKCNDGYTKQNSICLPHCQRPCANGVCSGPDKCTCNVDFDIDPLDRYNCRPICEIPCVNATCVAPGTCSCFPGYQPLNSTMCEPKCDGCSNGDCIAPDECRCNAGYTLEGGICVPKCNGCNGVCTAPNTCVCRDGFVLSNGTCKPVCKPKCVNSVCVGPNECKCIEGYQRKTNTTCERHCDNCENGRCLKGNYCFCNEGYSLVMGVCTPSCSVPCVNARCVAPNTCECFEGYLRNDTTPNNCFKTTITVTTVHKNCTCNDGKCVDDKCVCDTGFKLFEGSCIEIKPVECKTCEGICSDGLCWCKDGEPCYHLEEPAEVGAPTQLAGLELGWLLGGVVGLALLTLVIIAMGHIWRKRREYGVDDIKAGGNEIGSVVYTVPDTLLTRRHGSVVNIYGTNEDYNDSVNEPLRPTDEAL